MMRIANHVVLLLSALLVLSSCLPLDKEEEVRAELSGLVYLAQTRRFTSKPTCTAAIFDLASSSVRSQAVRIVSDVRSGLNRLPLDKRSPTIGELAGCQQMLPLAHSLCCC